MHNCRPAQTSLTVVCEGGLIYAKSLFCEEFLPFSLARILL